MSIPRDGEPRSPGPGIARDGALAEGIGSAVAGWDRLRAALTGFWSSLPATVTAFGWCVLALSVIGLGGGYLLGWAEFVALGWASAFLSVLCALYLVGRTGYRVTLDLPVDRVVVGDSVPGEVVVENPTRRFITPIRVEIPVGSRFAEFAIPGLARGAEASEVFVVPAERRGVISVGPVRTVRGDPLGLFRRELSWDAATEVFVHPRTIPIPSVSTGFVRDLEGTPTRDITSSDVSFHALREYMPGDDRRFIHWRSSAKTGTYMVRQFEETRRSHVLVALSRSSGDFPGEDDFELAVSAAASLGIHAIRDGRTVSVLVSGQRAAGGRGGPTSHAQGLRTESRRRLLDDLTLVETSPDATAFVDVVRIAAQSVRGASVAFLVCGAGTSINMLRQSAAVLPPGIEVTAVICDTGVVPSLRRIAGLTVVTIGFLDDLQKSLARTLAGA